MKLKNGILALIVTLALGGIPKAVAVVFPDQMVVNTAGDDENNDAISRFGGASARGAQQEAAISKPLQPISDSSFESAPGRAPASVGGRGPAMVKPHTVKIQPSDPQSSKGAIVRKANQKKAYQEVAVIANELGFFPSTLFLTQGIGVRLYITGASQKSQCFMLDQFGIRRQVRSQKVEEVTFTPDQSGTFSFHCPMNGARGTIVVKELEIGERTPASVSISAANAVPVEEHQSEIQDGDFSPEFRNH